MSDMELKEEVFHTVSQFNGNVEINRNLSYVAVGDFYTQGEQAIEIIKDIDSLVERLNISEREAAIFIIDNM